MSRSWTEEKHWVDLFALSFDNTIRLYTTENWFCKLLIFIVCFGRKKKMQWQTDNIAKAVGPYLFIPKKWTREQTERIIPHEARHVWQFKVCGLYIHPMVGIPVMGLLYLFGPLPVYFNPMRVWFELDAEAFAWECKLKTGELIPDLVRWRASSFSYTVSSWLYGKPLPEELIRNMFSKKAEKVILEYYKQTELG